MSNVVCELLGIRYPIIQGAMAHIADGNLAAGVSSAGGLGIIAAGNAPISWVKEQIDILRSKTDKPFGVNVMLMSETAPDVARLVIEQKVPVVTTGAGSPGPYMDDWKTAGVKILPVVPSSALAKRMERLGADGVIAEGCEAGGHIGELTTMALVPQVVDAVEIPVIAAGGVGDGRGMAAAFCLGAQGVQMGTRFLVSHECRIHDNYKEKVLSAKDTDTVVTGRTTGLPVRSLKNPMTKEFLSLERDQADKMELEEMTIGALRRAAVDGDKERGSFMSGQIAGMVKEKQTCEQIIQDVYEEAKRIVIAID